jgi:AraC family transcriptional activator of mtrCDE
MVAMDWLSRLFQVMPVSGRLDQRRSYGAPWRIDQEPGEIGEIPYYAIIAGSAVLEGPGGSRSLQLTPGDILLLPGNPHHVLHDGSGATPPLPSDRSGRNLTISENVGTGERLDMLCGHFVIMSPYDRLLRSYLPPHLVVHASAHGVAEGGSGTAVQLASLVTWIHSEATRNHLGGVAILNALSTVMFALVLRLASELNDAPPGLITLAGDPRLAPALVALLNEPARAWSLPELAKLCNMSRATLVRQFQEKLGRSASDLLTDIRMTLAANELRRPSMSTGAVANAVGYQSEAAFQRAFKNHMGLTPARWRKMRMLSGEHIDSVPRPPGSDGSDHVQSRL